MVRSNEKAIEIVRVQTPNVRLRTDIRRWGEWGISIQDLLPHHRRGHDKRRVLITTPDFVLEAEYRNELLVGEDWILLKIDVMVQDLSIYRFPLGKKLHFQDILLGEEIKRYLLMRYMHLPNATHLLITCYGECEKKKTEEYQWAEPNQSYRFNRVFWHWSNRVP